MYLCEEWRRSPYTKASRSFVKCLRGKAIFESQTVHQRLQGRYAPGCRCGCCVFLPPAMDVSDVSGSSTSKSQEIGHENPAFQCREKWAHGACILSGNNEPEPRGGCSLQMMLICRGPPPTPDCPTPRLLHSCTLPGCLSWGIFRFCRPWL